MTPPERERLIVEASFLAGWCTDNDLPFLSGFLLDVKHQMASDREGMDTMSAVELERPQTERGNARRGLTRNT